MKVIALHDEDGNILAAVQHSPGYDGPVPVASPGTTVTQLEVPDEHLRIGLADMCRRFKVHPKTKRLIESKAIGAE